MNDNKGWGFLDYLSTNTLRAVLLLVVGLLVGFSCSAHGGVILTAENDVWGAGTDNNYSHGTEIAWTTVAFNQYNEIERRDYGINQLMYTPSDITVSTNCLGDRPWAGVLTAFYERWTRIGTEVVRTRWSVGVLGPAAGSETSQKIVHRLIGSRQPKGWDNQLDNEPVLQYKHERHHPLYTTGGYNEFRLVSEGIYGGEVGTTFIDALGGGNVKLGWVPRGHMLGGIAPKVSSSSRPFIYAIAQVDGLFVLHNATLGDSYFHNKDEEERDLVPFVGEWYYGAAAGYKACTVTFLKSERTREFEGQPRTMDWGMIRLEFAVSF